MIVEWFSPRVPPRLEWLGQTAGVIATLQPQGVSQIASLIAMTNQQTTLILQDLPPLPQG